MSAAGDKLGTLVNTITNIMPIVSVENTITGSKSDLPGTSYGSGATVTVVVAPGIPAIKKWLAESIMAGECIDLAELPPGKESFRPPGGARSIAACSRVFSNKTADTRPGHLATVFCPVHGHHCHQTPGKDDFPVYTWHQLQN